MISPVYSLLNVPAVTALVGTRIYGFGQAPQGVTYPYITYQIISGGSLNYTDTTPNTDKLRVEINVWTRAQQDAVTVGNAVRTALDPHGHQLLQIGPSTDADTQSHRLQLDYSFFVSR